MRKESILSIVLVILLVGSVVYFFLPLHRDSGEIPSYVTGQMREVYGWAKTQTGKTLLEQIPCYCGCKYESHKHARHCFWKDDGTFDKHGITCTVCLDIAKRTKKMHEEGKDICEIRKEIDRFYDASKELATPTPLPEGCEGLSNQTNQEEPSMTGGPAPIHLDEAYSYFNDGTAIFIDVREPESIANAGGKIIRGAKVISLSDIENQLGNIDCDRYTIFYCEGTFGGGECSASPAAAKIVISKKGCSPENMNYLLEGYGAWEAAGYPVEPHLE